MNSETACGNDVMGRIKPSWIDHNNSLSQKRTSKPWIQYLDIVAVLGQYITAERTGNWDLHLQALSDMFPYCVASDINIIQNRYFYT